jgi:hypothetical protein
MVLEPLGAFLLGKVGLNNDSSGSVARMAEVGGQAFFAIKPYAHCGESISQIGLFYGYLDGHTESALLRLAGALASLSHRGQDHSTDDAERT